jgi:hypothetical protein
MRSFNLFFYFKIIFLCILLSCSSPDIKKNESIRFALINNTRGESPYSGLGPKIKPVIKKINDDNPVFLVHLGGIICGGTDWLGIAKIDVEKQYAEINSVISALLPIFYTVKGRTEIYNNSSDHYVKYSGKKEYYSFNYGTLHFLVLDSTGERTMSQTQKDWIKKDLEQAKYSSDIFVFIHDPVFVHIKFKSLGIESCKDSNLLHQYFTQYHVKAVFSGSYPVYFKSDIDGVLYVNAGCGGFNIKDFNQGYCQYYIADYKNGELTITPRYVTLK